MYPPRLRRPPPARPRPGRALRRWWAPPGALASALASALACGAPSLPPAPLGSGPTGGTGSGPAVVTTLTAGGDTGGVPARCRPDEPDASDDGALDGASDGDEAFRFDVGAPPSGSAFPVSCAEVVDTRTNLGCEFWATDLPNDHRGTPMSPPAAAQQFAVVVANPSGLEVAEVEVFVGDADTPAAQAAVEPGQTRTLALDPLDIEPRFGTDDGVAYRVASSVPVTAYQFNPLDNQVEVYSNDASLLLPTHALGREYTAVTADAILLGSSPGDPEPVSAGAFVSIVAAEDGTTVTVSSAAALAPGPQDAVLDRGQVLTVLSEVTGTTTGNLSGTRVSADAPVAVFSGNVATAIPSTGPCCADHVEHQLPPHRAWGTAYALAPPPSPVRDGDDPATYRFTAAFDDTELHYCPRPPSGAPERLDAGQTAVLVTAEPFSVESAPDRPFAVTQFLMSFEALSEQQPGDPAMIVAPPIDQFQRRTVLAVPEGYTHDFAIIVTRGSGEIVLDGDAIDPQRFQPVGVARGRAHQFVHVPLLPGAHTIESDALFGVTVVGFADAVSYGYPGAAGLRVIAIPPTAG